MTPGTREHYIATGFSLGFVAIMVALLVFPSPDFVSSLPDALSYGIAPIFVIGAALLLVGRLVRLRGPNA